MTGLETNNSRKYVCVRRLLPLQHIFDQLGQVRWYQVTWCRFLLDKYGEMAQKAVCKVSSLLIAICFIFCGPKHPIALFRTHFKSRAFTVFAKVHESDKKLYMPNIISFKICLYSPTSNRPSEHPSRCSACTAPDYNVTPKTDVHDVQRRSKM